MLSYYKFNGGPIHLPVAALKMWSDGSACNTFLVINALSGRTGRLAPFAIKNEKIILNMIESYIFSTASESQFYVVL